MARPYIPDPAAPLNEVPELRKFVENELGKIARAFTLVLPSQIEFLHMEPSKLREGMIVGADGTDWDPGSGKGVYAYYSGAWNKLG